MTGEGRGEGVIIDWRLTTQEKKRILINNIYGVDIDTQAVEVTKLSLLLRVLEGETQLSLFRERALPDLGNNIKCGNSLIGPDFYDNQQLGLLIDEEERYRINAFDWEKEFPQVFTSLRGVRKADDAAISSKSSLRGTAGDEAISTSPSPILDSASSPRAGEGRGEGKPQGGFDAVIGNPPYVRQEMLGDLKQYFKQHYHVYHGVADLYAYFIERGFSLLKKGGIFGIIVSNKWMRANYGGPLRGWMKEQHIEEIIDFGDLPVFQKATTYPCILLLSKDSAITDFAMTRVTTLDFNNLKAYVGEHRYEVEQTTLNDDGWSLVDKPTQELLNRLCKTGVPLGDYVQGKIYYGIKTGLNEAFVIDSKTRDRLIAEDPKSSEIIKPFLAGRDIKRYQPLHSDQYLIFTRRGINIKDYPAIEAYLLSFKDRLMPKPKDWKGQNWKGRKPGAYEWYEIQDTIDYYAEFEKPKIVLPDISMRGNFMLDDMGGFSCANTAYLICSASRYLLGVLNSSLMTFFYAHQFSTYRGGYLRFFTQYVSELPIHTINFSDPADKARHDRMVELVEHMLALHRQLAAAKTPTDKTAIQRQIDMTDRQIDQLVCELYDLTDAEIKIVEEGAQDEEA